MASSVIIYPATIHKNTANPLNSPSKRRTAAYARVSTDSDEQLNSYQAQVDYYTGYIDKRPDLEFIGIYTDEGISGVSTKGRAGFNRMVDDAIAGKIDLIITKSISRFARNTVDSLTTIRKLKDKGVEVYFEKENIYTFDSKGELLITLMASIAQEESRSISENVAWGHRKRFADGKVTMPYKHFLGYEKGEDGTPKIVESQAQVVRLIYRLFIEGKTCSYIARHLTAKEILSPAGKKRWQVGTVESILTNEKYSGDAILQKKITVDFLTKKVKINEGEAPRYYVQNSHPAIISPDEFEAVQVELQRRKKLGRPNGCQNPLSAKLVCSECGGYYGPKVWASNTKHRKTIWQCNDKYKGIDRCSTPYVTEDEVKEKFVIAFNTLFDIKEELVKNCELAIEHLADNTELDTEIDKLHDEIAIVVEESKKAIYENAHKAMSQNEWEKQHEAYVARHEKATERVKKLEEMKSERQSRSHTLKGFIRDIEDCGRVIDEFDERLWTLTVEKVVVLEDGGLRFCFKDGTEVEG